MENCPMEYQQVSVDRSGGVQSAEIRVQWIWGGGCCRRVARAESMHRAWGLNTSICYWSDEQVAVLKEERRGTRREALELDARPLRGGRLLPAKRVTNNTELEVRKKERENLQNKRIRLLEGRVVQKIYCFLCPRISSSVNLRVSDRQIYK